MLVSLGVYADNISVDATNNHISFMWSDSIKINSTSSNMFHSCILLIFFFCNMPASLPRNGKRGSRYEPVKMCNLYTRT